MASNLGAIGSGGEFKGFAPEDFDAYEKRKQTSNAYTLARRNAKDKLLALAKAITEELGEDLEALELGASEEAPSVANGRRVEAQWVFFTRDADQRATLKPFLQKTDLMSGASLFDISLQHQHACLMLRVDYEGFGIGVELATKAKVDRDNVAEKLKLEKWRSRLIEQQLKTLPGEAKIGFKSAMTSALDATETEAADWAARIAEVHEPFGAEVVISRKEELLGSDALIGTAAQYVSEFLPLFAFLAWSPENDHTNVTTVVEQEKVDRKKEAPQLKAGDRVVMLAGLFAGRPGYVAEIAKGKAKVMVGPVSVSVDVKDLKTS